MVIEKFKDIYEKRHEYAQDWQSKNSNKVIGYFCTYVPEEILYAADVLPVRILGSHEPQDVTEPHIFAMFCPFCRDCLAQGLLGRYDYLEGIMISQSCLHIRQAYTSWDIHMPREFSYFLPMPHHIQSPRAGPYLRAELETFKKAVEEWTGNTITDEDLDRGIGIMNENRALLRQIYEMRKADDPPITGLEAMYLVVSSQLMDKREHTVWLKELIPQLEDRSVPNTGERLMVLGSENDDVEFISLFESLGATFVVDDHCTGSRYFWNNVEPQDDRLAAIADRYIKRPACPTKDWPKRTRIEHIINLAKEYDVQGVVLLQQKFCDPHELDIPPIKEAFKEIDIPTLFLELDVTVPVGQIKIRGEAFLEILREEDLF